MRFVFPALGALLIAAGALSQGTPLTPTSAPDLETLTSQLALADQQWIPRAEPLANGGYRYIYKRRAGEPHLKPEQIRALIANPPNFASERQQIGQLLQVLHQAGVQVKLTAPRKSGAAAEWDPAARTLRIQPSVVGKGSLDFAWVLNHEAIHVAQSCRNQGIGSEPRLLGLPTQLPARLSPVLNQPIYREAPERVRQLEREAYANQERLSLGVQLVRKYC
jgi:hypothetical protein